VRRIPNDFHGVPVREPDTQVSLYPVPISTYLCHTLIDVLYSITQT